MDYKAELRKPEYDFLKTNPHLGNNIILIGLGGSHAYGMNTPTSDLDIRGITIEKPENLIGYQPFEQVIDTATDTTIYAFNKMVHLLTSNNPNTVEVLGLKPEHYLYLSPLGKELLEHKKWFLSQNCYYSFGGYAKAQLKRLENALARDNYPEERKNEHISISLESAISTFNQQHKTDINPAFAYVGDTGELRYALDMDISANDLEEFYSTVSNVTRTYKALLHRNRKKDSAHLCKHAAHLYRLLCMCFDLLTKEDIITYRAEEHDLLMSIRNGEYMNEDGNMKQEFYDMVQDIEDRCKEALEKTQLPKKPDIKKIENWIIEVNKKIIDGEYKEEFQI